MSNEENDKMPEQQPRQPQNLQGLMRFAIEANTLGEDTTCNNNLQPMDAERRAFLEKTLKSLTIDVIEVLQTCIHTLHELCDSQDLTEHNEKKCKDALETIQDYVDNLDTANDFFKIGGFKILPICLSSSWPSIRSHGCELIGDLAQNNPYCQENLLKCNVLEELFKLLLDEELVAVKAMYAISCMIRNYDPALEHLLTKGGFNNIVQVIGSKCTNDKLRTKGAFLLRALCLQDSRVRSELVKLDTVEYLSSALSVANESREHIMSALLSIICSLESNNTNQEHINLDAIGEEAISRARKADLNLKGTLDNFVKDCQNKPEVQEVFEYASKMQELIFKSET
uniref:Putative armadillo/beta-catenin-like repeat-containing protein n=1 Tax=Xenopsylla cheopis TaxID=163159 RepID=A0A6M2DQP4_XENCH